MSVTPFPLPATPQEAPAATSGDFDYVAAAKDWLGAFLNCEKPQDHILALADLLEARDAAGHLQQMCEGLNARGLELVDKYNALASTASRMARDLETYVPGITQYWKGGDHAQDQSRISLYNANGAALTYAGAQPKPDDRS